MKKNSTFSLCENRALTIYFVQQVAPAAVALLKNAAEDSAQAVIESYSKPSLAMALRLFENVIDMQAGEFLFSTAQGADLIAGLARATQKLHLLPPTWAIQTLGLASKTIWMSAAWREKKSTALPSEVLAILNALGGEVISLTRRVSDDVSKAKPGAAPSQTYKALCQAAVMASNMLSLDLFETVKESEGAEPVPADKVVESAHPYLDNTDTYEVVESPGAKCYTITFDGRSRLASKYDYVRFYKDDSRTSYWGQEKYLTESLPGTAGSPPLIIPSPRFIVHFHSSNPAERVTV